MITLQVGVKAFLKNKEGKFLLLKRNMEKYGDVKGTWDIVGGRINPGTTLEENLAREIVEETQLKLSSGPRLIAAQDILKWTDKHVVRLTYVAAAEGDLVLDTSENTDYVWLTLEELKSQTDLDVYVKDVIDKGLLR